MRDFNPSSPAPFYLAIGVAVLVSLIVIMLAY